MATNNATNTSNPITVSQGGTGNATATAYAVQCGGTTTTAAHQSIASVGTSGQVLTSNGAGSLPSFQAVSGGASSAFGTLTIIEDFLAYNLSGPVGNTVWNTVNGITIAGVANHPGILRNGQGTTIYSASTGAAGILPANGTITLEMVIRIPATGATNVYLGLSDTLTIATLTEPVNGCYFNYASGTNSGQWVGKTSSASTRSSANSANTVTAGNWDRLKIVINSAGTAVNFFVNGTEISNSPLSTNIPTAALQPFFTVQTSATVNLDIDLMVLTYVLAVSR
jgi:hypothetical protein